MLQTITDITPQEPYSLVEEVAYHISTQAPELKDLSHDQLWAIGNLVVKERLTQQMSTEVVLAGIDFKKEKSIFLDSCSSKHTKRNYKEAINKLEKYTQKHSIKILALNYSQADDFIHDLQKQDYSTASINLTVTAIKTFYDRLSRKFQIINPFTGSKTQKTSAKKELRVPTEKEVRTILAFLPIGSIESAIINTMVFRGLRAGALPELKISGSNFSTFTKGQLFSGKLPAESIKAIKESGLPTDRPFKNFTANAIEKRLKVHTRRLAKEGLINFAYSSHSFRHYYACQQYQESKDAKRVQLLLGHKNLATTDHYLRSMGLVEV